MNPTGPTSSATAIARALRAREISAREVVELCIARIEQVNPALNAVVGKRYAAARAEAIDADARLGKGDPAPLLGVPCTVKEFLSVRGMPHTAGLPSRREVIAEVDATVVARLQEAGAIVLGVTNAPEGGLWHETNNPVHGRTSNPHDLRRTTGGSSGGEAAILAAGGVPFGIGSDTGGSLRIPAGFCGVVSHKPTAGLVPMTGHFPAPPGTPEDIPSVVGPMARTVEDLWTVLRLVAGPDGVDPLCREVPLVGNLEDHDWSEVEVYPLPTNGRFRPRPEVASAVHKAALALEARGARVREWPGPDISGAFEAWVELLSASGKSYADLISGGEDLGLLREWARWAVGRSGHSGGVLAVLSTERLLSGRVGSEERLAAARELRVAFARTVGPRGLVIHPVYPRTAPRHRAIALRDPRDVGCTTLFNVCEGPVTVVRVDTDRRGLPVGVQIAGAPGADVLTLAAARVCETLFGAPAPVDPR
jgi:fatty acid amide hydrolase 2